MSTYNPVKIKPKRTSQSKIPNIGSSDLDNNELLLTNDSRHIYVGDNAGNAITLTPDLSLVSPLSTIQDDHAFLIQDDSDPTAASKKIRYTDLKQSIKTDIQTELNPLLYKVKVNSNDTSPNYLENKITTTDAASEINYTTISNSQLALSIKNNIIKMIKFHDTTLETYINDFVDGQTAEKNYGKFPTFNYLRYKFGRLLNNIITIDFLTSNSITSSTAYNTFASTFNSTLRNTNNQLPVFPTNQAAINTFNDAVHDMLFLDGTINASEIEGTIKTFRVYSKYTSSVQFARQEENLIVSNTLNNNSSLPIVFVKYIYNGSSITEVNRIYTFIKSGSDYKLRQVELAASGPTYTAGPGISITSDVISAVVNSTGGLEINSGIKVKLRTNSGLTTDANGLGLNIDTNRLSITSNTLSVKLKSNGGLTSDSNGLFVQITEIDGGNI